jgi:hypothetical protein
MLKGVKPDFIKNRVGPFPPLFIELFLKTIYEFLRADRYELRGKRTPYKKTAKMEAPVSASRKE